MLQMKTEIAFDLMMMFSDLLAKIGEFFLKSSKKKISTIYFDKTLWDLFLESNKKNRAYVSCLSVTFV